MNTNGARASTAPGEQEPSPPEALHRLQQQIEELQAYFTHFVSAKVDGFLLSGRQLALWTALGIMGLLALAGLIITAIVLLLGGAAAGLGLLFGGQLWLGQGGGGGGVVGLVCPRIFLCVRTLPKRSGQEEVQ